MAEKRKKSSGIKPELSVESLVFIVLFLGVFILIGQKMGGVNMINSMMKTAYDLLMNTVLYIMALAVLTGAVSGLFTEFGVVSALNKLISPLMRPLYGLPGAAMMGVIATY